VIDWGDGETPQQVTEPSEVTYTYENEGVYIIKISGVLDTFGNDGERYNSLPTLVEVISFGSLGIKDLESAFNSADELSKVPATLPSTVITIAGLFYNLDKFNDPKIMSWDTSNVTNMRELFYYTDIFDQDLSKWKINQAIKDDPDNCSYFADSVDVLQCIHLPAELPQSCSSGCID
jgi:hypothetical protein